MTKIADKWFDGVDFVSIVDTIKGVMTSDGTMSTLLDFERVLDQCDLYAFRNWINGELVQGPDVGRYNVSCIFMWPYKLMPDPRAVKRLLKMGCNVKWDKTEIEVPVKVTNPDDFIQGTNYPKSAKRKVWLVQITVPLETMDDIKQGSVDLAGSTVDLEEIDDAYDEDLDKDGVENDDQKSDQSAMQQPMAAPAQ